MRPLIRWLSAKGISNAISKQGLRKSGYLLFSAFGIHVFADGVDGRVLVNDPIGMVY